MNKITKTLILFVGILLYITTTVGCSTSKTQCDAYGYTTIDTLYIPTEHLNYDGICYEYKHKLKY